MLAMPCQVQSCRAGMVLQISPDMRHSQKFLNLDMLQRAMSRSSSLRKQTFGLMNVPRNLKILSGSAVAGAGFNKP